ncbi:MAG: hypothetical protein JST82_13070 [Bacteroidetes bacterium]|nr:hypothetical protein [Bacteroidota bacterium]
MKKETVFIPIIIGNCAPFRLIVRENDKWHPTLEELNYRAYDYVKLHRMSTYLDVGISPFSLGIGFDGSLILPAIEKYRNFEIAADTFNEVLTYLMFGGIYSESITPSDITPGRLSTDSYFTQLSSGKGRNSSFHSAIRTKHVGTMDVISLLDVQKITVKDFTTAYSEGKNVFKKLGNISPSILLNGISHFVKHEYSDGLISLWTCVEQVIAEIWTRRILDDCTNQKINGRKQFLEDNRTWTIAAKIEVLYQRKIITSRIYSELNISRKARNLLIHSGASPQKRTILNTLTVLFQIYSLLLSNYKKSTLLKSTLDKILKNYNSDIYPKNKVLENVSHYLHIPPIPGDSGWGDKSYEVIDELKLAPLDKIIP